MLEKWPEADFWRTQGDTLICELCPHGCHIAVGQGGRCRVRQNINGRLCSVNFGQVSAIALDPIEKKPFYRFKPGSRILSVGSWGCNLSCRFCQNWRISQEAPPVKRYTPDELVALSLDTVPKGNIGLAYTYSEPLVWYEFVHSCARLIKDAGLDNILITNGYINPRPLRELSPLIAAANVDLKAFSPDFYKDICGGSLPPVLENIKLLAGQCHVEITALIVPDFNDGLSDMERLASWLTDVDPNIPLHINRYFPNYQFSAPQTPKETLLELKQVAERHLRYVYVGNV